LSGGPSQKEERSRIKRLEKSVKKEQRNRMKRLENSAKIRRKEYFSGII
jgi:hypothetical protein